MMGKCFLSVEYEELKLMDYIGRISSPAMGRTLDGSRCGIMKGF
jgi:hypothetical protein